MAIKLVSGLHLTKRERQMLVFASENRNLSGCFTGRMSVEVDWSVAPYAATFRKNERDDRNRSVVRTYTVQFNA